MNMTFKNKYTFLLFLLLNTLICKAHADELREIQCTILVSQLDSLQNANLSERGKQKLQEISTTLTGQYQCSEIVETIREQLKIASQDVTQLISTEGTSVIQCTILVLSVDNLRTIQNPPQFVLDRIDSFVSVMKDNDVCYRIAETIRQQSKMINDDIIQRFKQE